MFMVTIITKCGSNMITEKAGVRGEKALISMEGANGIKMNPKPRKIAGWKTREGALNFIRDCLKNDMLTGKDSWYQVEVA